MALYGFFYQKHEFIAYRFPHASHEKGAVQHGSQYGEGIDGPKPAVKGIGKPSFLPGFSGLFRITRKMDRVAALYIRIKLLETAFIQSNPHPDLSGDGHMEPAGRADI